MLRVAGATTRRPRRRRQNATYRPANREGAPGELRGAVGVVVGVARRPARQGIERLFCDRERSDQSGRLPRL
jgi:hypothetical protein